MLQTFQNLDGTVLLAIQGLRQEWLDPLVEGYTALGNAGMLWLVLAAAMLFWRPTRKAGALALAAMLLGLLCTNVVLKPLVARERPWLHVAGLVPLIAELDPYSFPSGHTTAAFAAGMTWAAALPRKWIRVLAAVMAVCMGLSRLYVGVHYPSDVLGGALVGSFCAWLAWTGYHYIWNRKENRPEPRP